MAEIPVERNTKSGLPWWLIPLLLLLLLLPLLWFMSRGCNTAPVANNNGNANRVVTNANANSNRGVMNANMGAMGTDANGASGSMTNAGGNGSSTISVDNKGTATGSRVTDVNIFGNSANKNALVGSGAELTQVKVNRVLSDRVFTVTSGRGEMFMMLDENLDSDGGKESQIKMRPGQLVNLNGEFRRVPDGNTQEETQNRDLSQKEYAQMKGQQIYLHVKNVEDTK